MSYSQNRKVLKICVFEETIEKSCVKQEKVMRKTRKPIKFMYFGKINHFKNEQLCYNFLKTKFKFGGPLDLITCSYHVSNILYSINIMYYIPSI